MLIDIAGPESPVFNVIDFMVNNSVYRRTAESIINREGEYEYYRMMNDNGEVRNQEECEIYIISSPRSSGAYLISLQRNILRGTASLRHEEH